MQKLKGIKEPFFGDTYYPDCEFAERKELSKLNVLCTKMHGAEGCSSEGHYWCSVAVGAGKCPEGRTNND